MAHVTSAHENTSGLPRVPSIPLAEDTDSHGEQSIGNLVKDATAHLSTLVRAEIELARSEVGAEVRKAFTGSASFIIAAVLGLLLLPFLLTSLALGLNKVLWDWFDPWGGFLVVALLMGLGAGLLALRGYRKFRAIRAPQRTIDSVRGTAAALRDRGEPGAGHDVAAVPADAVRRV